MRKGAREGREGREAVAKHRSRDKRIHVSLTVDVENDFVLRLSNRVLCCTRDVAVVCAMRSRELENFYNLFPDLQVLAVRGTVVFQSGDSRIPLQVVSREVRSQVRGVPEDAEQSARMGVRACVRLYMSECARQQENTCDTHIGFGFPVALQVSSAASVSLIVTSVGETWMLGSSFREKRVEVREQSKRLNERSSLLSRSSCIACTVVYTQLA